VFGQSTSKYMVRLNDMYRVLLEHFILVKVLNQRHLDHLVDQAHST
jgi:hypothetical protein